MFPYPYPYPFQFRPPRRRKKKPAEQTQTRDDFGTAFGEFLVHKFIHEYEEREAADKEKAKKDKEKADKDKDKKPEGPKMNPLALATILFLSMPIVGPAYVYFAIAMLKSSMDMLNLK